MPVCKFIPPVNPRAGIKLPLSYTVNRRQQQNLMKNNNKIDYRGERAELKLLTVIHQWHVIVKHLHGWFGGGQEAIPYNNSEVNT